MNFQTILFLETIYTFMCTLYQNSNTTIFNLINPTVLLVQDVFFICSAGHRHLTFWADFNNQIS